MKGLDICNLLRARDLFGPHPHPWVGQYVAGHVQGCTLRDRVWGGNAQGCVLPRVTAAVTALYALFSMVYTTCGNAVTLFQSLARDRAHMGTHAHTQVIARAGDALLCYFVTAERYVSDKIEEKRTSSGNACGNAGSNGVTVRTLDRGKSLKSLDLRGF